MDEPTRILIVDDQTLFADSLKSVLGFRAPDFCVIGVANDGAMAVTMARTEKPDIILMDIRMPGLDGVKATRIIHGEFPEIKIIVLTSFDDDDYIFDALNHGAMGYVLKDIPVNELISSLRAVRDGTISMSPAVARKVVERGRAESEGGRSSSQAEPTAPPEWLATLGKREREILLLVGRGMDNSEIASELFISEQTVKNYVYTLYTKLGEHSRPRVMQIATRHKDRLSAKGTPE